MFINIFCRIPLRNEKLKRYQWQKVGNLKKERNGTFHQEKNIQRQHQTMTLNTKQYD